MSDLPVTDHGTQETGGPTPEGRTPGAVDTGIGADSRVTSDMFGATFGGDTTGFGGLVRRAPDDAGTPRPYGGWFDEFVDALEAVYPSYSDAVKKVVIDRNELTLHVDAAHVADVARVMRDDENLRFELLSNLSGVDYPAQERRLHVVYNLTSMTYRRRVRLEVAVTTEDPHVQSVCDVYPTADFHERECWDMFGVVFDGHPALTRILMPDDWDGHPQRKDYPLGGVPVEYKGAQIPPPDERRAYA
ncbi:MAG: NADH-quinone oxidoreductase subunit [Actinomycetota bacterium]|jgi:NADH-quinone oxidoreductase subunit C|nr:NADH-quinone oxidoreductase subunit [Actinomycetota bacterium]